jgi:exodeoxyribonuclease-3
VRLLTWNVNGLRARIKQGFSEAINELKPDILCIQETRARPEQLPAGLLSDYIGYYSIHKKAGYAGATTFIRKDMEPFLHVDDFPENDEPGRVSILDFKDFKLINAYVPNAGQRLEKMDHRILWQKKLEDYVADQVKPIIYCGDFNCAHKPLDVGAPSVKSGVSFQERGAFQRVLDYGLVDAWRELHPEVQQYTWFSVQFNSKPVNRGLRIDSFIVSQELMPLVQNCLIVQDDELVCGSDHCPVILDINI